MKIHCDGVSALAVAYQASSVLSSIIKNLYLFIFQCAFLTSVTISEAKIIENESDCTFYWQKTVNILHTLLLLKFILIQESETKYVFSMFI